MTTKVAEHREELGRATENFKSQVAASKSISEDIEGFLEALTEEHNKLWADIELESEAVTEEKEKEIRDDEQQTLREDVTRALESLLNATPDIKLREKLGNWILNYKLLQNDREPADVTY